jgi:hypothetical protein
MAVSPLMWRKRLMDSISSNLGYYKNLRGEGCPAGQIPYPVETDILKDGKLHHPDPL